MNLVPIRVEQNAVRPPNPKEINLLVDTKHVKIQDPRVKSPFFWKNLSNWEKPIVALCDLAKRNTETE